VVQRVEVVKGISVGVEAATRAVVSGPWRGYKLTLYAQPGTTVALDPIRPPRWPAGYSMLRCRG
jgi:hypothetical protein